MLAVLNHEAMRYFVILVCVVLWSNCTKQPIESAPPNADDTAQYDGETIMLIEPGSDSPERTYLHSDEISLEQVDQETSLDEVMSLAIKDESSSLEARSVNPYGLDVPPEIVCPDDPEAPLIFAVYDAGDPAYDVWVKLRSPSGALYHVRMRRYGNYQLVGLRMITTGRWEFEYISSTTQQPITRGTIRGNRDVTKVFTSSQQNNLVRVYGMVGSGYYLSCGHGCNFHTWQYGEYYAQDWAGSAGGRVTSPLDGKVITSGWHNLYGNYVVVEQKLAKLSGSGDETITFLMAHLQSRSVSVGSRVYGGLTTIGYVGSTGNSTGPHVHCVVRKNGMNVPFTFTNTCD